MPIQKFYDIHFHAMTLAHPNILAFVRRIRWSMLLLASPLAPIAAFLGMRKIKNVENLLSVMENDIGSFFMLVEYYLRKTGLVKNDVITIGGESFDSIVITPLLLDFGYKNILTETFYKIPPEKPIVSQADDVFSGIADYCANELHEEIINNKLEYWIVPRTTKAIFEIYPFLGLNTHIIHHLTDLQAMLDRYFENYQGRYIDFKKNLGKFEGDIKKIGGNFFAGIKLYPPIGFDPWPDDACERAKVEYLYKFCCAHEIPVTVHCSDGGFSLDNIALELTNPEKWTHVLAKDKFETLKLNFAHFGKQEKIFSRRDWRDRILGLIKNHPNVYADFSYIGLDDAHYHMLQGIYEKNPFMRDKLLFGSDFMINLLDMGSYNSYLDIFSKTAYFSAAQKKAFCNANPERFLWRKGGA